MRPSNQPDALAANERRGRILLVDDDIDVRGSLEALLVDEGYEVSACGDGRQALALLHANPMPDLMILDLMLPKMDGWELCAVQRADPAIVNIPVVAISADWSAKAAAIHAEAFLRKPFVIDELLHAVERILFERGVGSPKDQLEYMHRLALVGMLTAGFEHELRNPLASMLTNLQLAIESMPDLHQNVAALRSASLASDVDKAVHALSDLGGMVADAHTGATRIHRVVESMGMLARSQRSGRVRIPLAESLDRAIQLTTTQMQRKVRLERSCLDGIYVVAEEVRLSHVFLALLLNANRRGIDDSPHPPEIRVRVQREADCAVVEVIEERNNGTGRGTSTNGGIRSDSDRERGLDFYICRGIIASFGGTLDVALTEKGARHYRVTIPEDKNAS